MPDQKRALPEPQPKRQKQEQEGEYDDNHIPWKTFETQSEQYLHHETSTTEEMQHAIEPANEEHIKHMTQMHSEKGNLAPHETPPKSIAAANAEKASISQPKYVENTFERPRSTSVPQPTELYAQMIPPVIDPNLRGNLDYDANCQQDLFASTAEF
ncbi:hypothetical protein N7449_004676 [Penicillium cf. viridicatum]|uniref:Uncharacterized protein n=1 Tax=Penicillium cf. viridicatum TaxID=2972119 RepID=A0A9W9MK25_9EURO|nr:hypothetical protein N7449_004676 [Penicillium cf. viridicatum]